MFVFDFEYCVRIRSYCIDSVFVSCLICNILQTVTVMSVSGEELKGDKGKLERSIMCDNYPVFDSEWKLYREIQCQETEIELDERCGRNKQRLEYLLNISTSKIHSKKKKQIIGCIPGDVMVAILFPVHKSFNTDKKSSQFLRSGNKINFESIIAIEDLWKLLTKNKSIRGYTIGAYIIEYWNSESAVEYQILKLLEYTFLRTNYSYFEGSCISNLNEPAPLIGVLELSGEKRFTEVINSLLNSLKIPVIRDKDFLAWIPLRKRRISIIYIRLGNVTFENIEEQVRVFSWETDPDTVIILSILNHFKWTYISLLYTEDYHNLNQFGVLANYYNVCIAKSEIVYANRHEEYYRNLAAELKATKKAKVIVSFIRDSLVMLQLLKAMSDEMEEVENFILLSSTEWEPSDHDEFFKYVRQSIKLPHILIFKKMMKLKRSLFEDDYRVTDDVSVRNPWLKDIVQTKYNCTFNTEEVPKQAGRSCIGRSLPLNDTYTGVGVDYYLRMSYHMSRYQERFERFLLTICNDRLNCTRPSLAFMRYIDNKQRLDSVCHMQWSEIFSPLFYRGSQEQMSLSFEILHQPVVHNKSIFILVGQGEWNLTTYRMDVTEFSRKVTKNLKRIKSNCSDLCSPSQKKIIPNPATPCCWVCINACPTKRMIYAPNNTISTNTSCVQCMEDEWPNDDQTKCKKLPVTKLEWDDPEMLFSSAYSVLVIGLTMMSFAVFVKHRNTPVVKSSTKELSFIMLIAIIVINCLVFINMAECTESTCSVLRILLSSSLVTLYAALLVKTVRIARLLALSKGQFPKLKMRFMSIKSQIIFTTILLIFQLIVVSIGLYFRPSKISLSYKYCPDERPHPHSIRYVCGMDEKTWLFDYLFLSVLILLSTACAVWTRNVPDNFNEAKYIGFSMYSTCITWLGFWLIYFNTDYKVITLCLCSSTNSLIMLIFLYFPKLYVIIWKPEKNNRCFFTTSEGIRRHIGNDKTEQVSLEPLTTN